MISTGNKWCTLLHGELVTLVYSGYFILQNGFGGAAMTDVADISFYAEGSLFFFQKYGIIRHSSSAALKLHGLKKLM